MQALIGGIGSVKKGNIKVRIIGACGYGGLGIIDLLSQHPLATVVSLVDLENVGKRISEKFPYLEGFCDLVISAPDQASWDEEIDVVFTATPDGVGMQVAPKVVAAGARLIDYSGDFRFADGEEYADYAGRIGRPTEHASPDLLEKAAYGVTELHRDEIKGAPVVGNPGCFAISAILGLAPAVRSGLVDLDTLICDAKTGVSGAGIKASPTFHYPTRYENMNAYKIAAHQHTVEVEKELSRLAGKPLRVTLTTQVVPLARGIMTTIYGRLKGGATEKDLHNAYREFYEGSAFVRVRPMGVPVSNNDVRGSNLCVLSTNADPRTGQMIVVSHIDNLMKGQAGSALQNMNVMFGLDETVGLRRPAFFP
jgi:N-acetyl-gamma-glutamyl-phosphate reductase